MILNRAVIAEVTNRFSMHSLILGRRYFVSDGANAQLPRTPKHRSLNEGCHVTTVWATNHRGCLWHSALAPCLCCGSKAC
ncbi:hypothetical protein Bcep1808_5480 [Burkholderia vietnamiensis G4]|uniref:Uncharacterized protein n=1 Tax=Burkholderia vietnamiensis (strain G4 / LMG 22486) TaxID=269482 RepID=A4JQ71_BURVG|nr:hypothetical protein Bcep1808_5480 [Burkholderia vietnamiensis G4]